MKKFQFPYIASGLGLFLMLAVMAGSKTGSNGATTLPLLTLLIMSEFGFFLTGIAAFFGVRHIQSAGKNPVYMFITGLCVVLSISFLWLGIQLWPQPH
jgi:heme/copper-type cytochrome/quinol oxidase subunit 3